MSNWLTKVKKAEEEAQRKERESFFERIRRQEEWRREEQERAEKEAQRQYFSKGDEEWNAVIEKLHRPSPDPNPDPEDFINDWVVYKVWLEGDPEPCRFCGRPFFGVRASSRILDEYYGESEEKVYNFTLCTHCE